MNRISERLVELNGQSDTEGVLADFEEEAIVSIALDNPEYFLSIHHLLDPAIFTRLHTKFLINELLDCAQRYQTIPTRPAFLKHIKKLLTVDYPGWEEAVEVVKRPASYRDIPMVKEKLDEWIKRKQIDKLYGPEGTSAYQSGDFTQLIDIVEGITKFQQVSYRCFSLVEDQDSLWLPSNNEHITTGYKSLDRYLNNGGPSPGEVIIYMGPTNVGKSIFLCNTSVHHYKAGLNTLLITYELDRHKMAKRCLAPFTGIPINDLDNHRDRLKNEVQKTHCDHNHDLKILEWPPDEISVHDIYAALQNLKRQFGFVPQSIVIDYMDLMVSCRNSDNEKDYSRQKYIALQLCALAKKTNCVVTTATQTNRSGNDSSVNIDLTKAAESYGKMMPLDYVITINQSESQHAAGKIVLYIAKNRNGQKLVSVMVDVNYSILSTKESM